MTNLTQFSNILNICVQSHNELKSYQYGFLSDINTSRQNNFDETGYVGKLYPNVVLLPPDIYDIKADRRYYNMKLFVFEQIGYDNNASQKTNTMLEIHSKLTDLFNDIIEFLRFVSDETSDFEVLEVSASLDGAAHVDNLIYIEGDIKISFMYKCGEPTLFAIPEIYDLKHIPLIDLEKQTADKWQP